MGTPEFAVASLKALVEEGFNIAGVVTAPDKPAGRGMKLTQSAVKVYAESKGLKILQPEKLKNPEFIGELKALNADLQVVVAFRMLPEIVWNMPPLGTINLHGSLLPKYRGAAPINWAVINGEKETGVTTFKLQHAIDTGNILLQEKFPISETDTAGDVHDTMKEIGAKVLVKTVEALLNGSIKDQPQPELADIPHAPKIFTETCKIDWTRSAEEIYNLIRGLSPFPGAFTTLDNKTLKVLKATRTIAPHSEASGSYKTDGKTSLQFAAADGYVQILELQMEGKKKMNTEDFLRGYRFSH
ncbi:MAG: methionyl-tRNA formyltransferase [Chitinophagaceae bacterium]|nr:MAG: methionyl-tRNA formyltransferase [Chitinophagaceae bacterium]